MNKFLGVFTKNLADLEDRKFPNPPTVMDEFERVQLADSYLLNSTLLQLKIGSRLSGPKSSFS